MVGLGKLALLGAVLFNLTSVQSLPVQPKDNQTDSSNQYIVTLRDGLDESAVEEHLERAVSLRALSDSSSVVELGRRWNIGSWNAYSCVMNNDTLTEMSRDDAGLGATSHRVPNHTDYVYDSKAGEGTYAYIIDSGLLPTHEEFEDRAILGYNAVGGPFVDDTGHGTHVAGTIGGKTYGVAKKAKLVSVKIFRNGRGHFSDVLEGYQWAVYNITTENRQNVSAINISGGGGSLEALNRAVEEGYKQGVLTVVAAGNYDKDVQNYSPASAPNAMTVGSVGRNFKRSKFSNWGRLVDIFAPGEDIKSAYIGSNTDAQTHSGTSMATPHITGLILYLKSMIPYRTKTPVTTVWELQNLATDNIIKDTKGSKNLLGFNGNGIVIV
ncbi:oryzin precursor [Hypoxylon rubiginosum]|uniref:Oryzin n=1 Tax=Hypoxylon rubiginosum TaxID=110542 RepID=A0ACC0DJH5_9PEZI|nr:oryzin precursor [Hypoxylon rubiginosum]